MNRNKKITKVSKKSIFIITIALIIILFIYEKVTGNLGTVLGMGKSMTLVPLTDSIVYDVNRKVDFGVYNDDIIQCSMDGIKKISLDGEVLLNKTYDMQNPVLTVAYPWIVVGDYQGNQIIVYKDDNLQYSIRTKWPILLYKINENGMLLVGEYKNEEYFVNLYDNKGEKILSRNIPIKQEGHLVDIAISHDGKKIVTSHIDSNGTKPKTKITFLSIAYEGQKYIDRVTGAEIYEDEIVPKIEFVDNDHIIGIGDIRTHIYQYRLMPEILRQDTHTNKIYNASMSRKGVYGIGYGENIEKLTDDQPYNIILYDEIGRIKSRDFNHSRAITYLYVNDNENIIVGIDREINILDKNLKIIGKYNANRDIKKVLSFKAGKKYLIVSNDKYQVLELKRGGDKHDGATRD